MSEPLVIFGLCCLVAIALGLIMSLVLAPIRFADWRAEVRERRAGLVPEPAPELSAWQRRQQRAAERRIEVGARFDRRTAAGKNHHALAPLLIVPPVSPELPEADQ